MMNVSYFFIKLSLNNVGMPFHLNEFCLEKDNFIISEDPAILPRMLKWHFLKTLSWSDMEPAFEFMQQVRTLLCILTHLMNLSNFVYLFIYFFGTNRMSFLYKFNLCCLYTIHKLKILKL